MAVKPKSQSTYVRDNRSPIPLNETVSKYMRSNKSKNTKPEMLFRKALWQAGIRGYRLHWKKAPGKPDIAFPSKKIAIFLNGCFWHRCPNCNLSLPKNNQEFWQSKFERNIARDKEKIEALENENWEVLVIWECEMKEDLGQQIEKVRRLLNPTIQNK
ncbi:MAG: very short patch repair endonuclease [Flavobacteriales bacterium]|nr:very short patch repair endonuclease [Flavobacteriales bacterium]MCB9190607.1 very short patch repair endonuclease [Flavobacteriales bacterium]